MDDATGIWRPKNQRHCPRCTYPMTAIGYGGAEIDHCHRCGGMLVEPGSIETHVGEWADPSVWMDRLGSPTRGERLACPVDGGTMTGFQVPWGGRSVVIDHCDGCGSLYFDHGEAAKLVEIVKAADAEGGLRGAVSDMMPDHQLAKMQNYTERPGLRVYLFQLFTGMPVEVLNPVYGKAYVVRALVLLLAAVFVIEMAIILPMEEAAMMQWLDRWGLVPALVLRGEHLWTLFTHAFLHGGLLHFLGNAYFLWVFGDNVEDRVGHGSFLVLYAAALFGAAALQTVMQSDPHVPLVGASGAIAGVMGAYLVLFPRVKLWMVFFFIQWRVPVLVYLGFWALMQLGLGFLDVPGVGWWAHLGGFVVGVLLGFVLRDSPHPLAPPERAVAAYPRR